MYGQEGVQSLAAGGIGKLRLDKRGALWVRGGAARYEDLVRAGMVFSAANQAAVSTTAALATTWTGLAVCNPLTSTKDLVMIQFTAGQSAAGAAGAIGLMRADTTGLASAITAVNQLAGDATASVAVVDNGATIGTPVLHRTYGSVGSLATTGYGLVAGLIVNLDGSIILQPGYSLLTYTEAANTSAFIFSFTWAEIAR